MSLWWLVLASGLIWVGLATAQPVRAWVPREQARMQAAHVWIARALCIGGTVLAYYVGRANP